MVGLFLLFSALMAAARPVSAQAYLGADIGPGALLRAEEARINREGEEAFARVFVLENSTADVYSVFETTVPERAVAAYLRQGIYRQELLMLFAIARSAKTPFSALAKKRAGGVTLRRLAGENKMDLPELFRASESLKQALEEKAALSDISADVLSPPPAAETDIPSVSAGPASDRPVAAHEDEKE